MIGDGRQILEGEDPQVYDYIILDAFTAAGTPRHLISREFFSITRSKLNTSGYILMNLMGKGEHDPLINAIYTTLAEEYAYIRAFSLPSEGAADIKISLWLAAAPYPLSSPPFGWLQRNTAGTRISDSGLNQD